MFLKTSVYANRTSLNNIWIFNYVSCSSDVFDATGSSLESGAFSQTENLVFHQLLLVTLESPQFCLMQDLLHCRTREDIHTSLLYLSKIGNIEQIVQSMM